MTETELKAAEAKSLLDNKIFKAAMLKMNQSLDMKMMSVNPDEIEKCARVVLAKQILNGIDREIKRFIVDGQVVMKLAELETPTMKDRIFKR